LLAYTIMSYFCEIRNRETSQMNKSGKFDHEFQELSRFAKVISHPARLAILKYLAETKTCISGDISEYLPLSRTIVSQHLKELKTLGLIHGEIDGLKVNYCLCSDRNNEFVQIFGSILRNDSTV
jgi:ArsR family transcriptional regulator, arsenate/arsenite/antimonite-responsive transcriptional repressor